MSTLSGEGTSRAGHGMRRERGLAGGLWASPMVRECTVLRKEATAARRRKIRVSCCERPDRHQRLHPERRLFGGEVASNGNQAPSSSLAATVQIPLPSRCPVFAATPPIAGTPTSPLFPPPPPPPPPLPRTLLQAPSEQQRSEGIIPPSPSPCRPWWRRLIPPPCTTMAALTSPGDEGTFETCSCGRPRSRLCSPLPLYLWEAQLSYSVSSIVLLGSVHVRTRIFYGSSTRGGSLVPRQRVERPGSRASR